MTKKHFEALADALHQIKPFTIAEYGVWRESVRSVADVCRASNSRFQRDKFYEACGVDDESERAWRTFSRTRAA